MKDAYRSDKLADWSDSKASVLCHIDSSLYISLPILVAVCDEPVAHADDTHPNNSICLSNSLQLFFECLQAGSSQAQQDAYRTQPSETAHNI